MAREPIQPDVMVIQLIIRADDKKAYESDIRSKGFPKSHTRVVLILAVDFYERMMSSNDANARFILRQPFDCVNNLWWF
jgi:hypothetical protein